MDIPTAALRGGRGRGRRCPSPWSLPTRSGVQGLMAIIRGAGHAVVEQHGEADVVIVDAVRKGLRQRLFEI
jgi:hypothetical protein